MNDFFKLKIFWGDLQKKKKTHLVDFLRLGQLLENGVMTNYLVALRACPIEFYHEKSFLFKSISQESDSDTLGIRVLISLF